jgi:chloramphenicol-sensitive protein RarD
LWGLLPIYWKQITRVPARQLIAHRIVWSFLLLVAMIALSRQWKPLTRAATPPRVLRAYTVAAVLISINWFTYVWAVNSGLMVETSLGYFINPLVSVLLGVVILRERLRPLQWVAVALAAAGVAYLTLAYGSLPWIALILAVSFGSYGLAKKVAPLGSVYGLTVETGVLLPPAILYLLYVDRAGQGAFLHAGLATDVLLAGTGLVTMIPLLLFASALQTVPLSLMGVLQYIAPTLQLLLGVLLYKEPFTRQQMVGFGVVWTALIVFGLDGWGRSARSEDRPLRELV